MASAVFLELEGLVGGDPVQMTLSCGPARQTLPDVLAGARAWRIFG